MPRRWVENTSSGPRFIGGELCQPGEGAWVEDGPYAQPNQFPPVRQNPVTRELVGFDDQPIQGLVSGAGNSQSSTEFPPERVVLAATGCVCGVPCTLVRIRCITGAAVALVVYDNPAASAGTQLYSGNLSAGQEANISAQIRAINGIRAAFASGSFEFYVSQEA